MPKGSTVEDLKDLRPISLVGSLYKILSKVLANRIKRVMGLIISQSQNAFVEGRQILDAALVANEAVDSVLRRKEKGILCKLDIEKAYDHIRWDFLLQTLERMGFGSKWIKWIHWCISTASFSIIFNGFPCWVFSEFQRPETRGSSIAISFCYRYGVSESSAKASGGKQFYS